MGLESVWILRLDGFKHVTIPRINFGFTSSNSQFLVPMLSRSRASVGMNWFANFSQWSVYERREPETVPLKINVLQIALGSRNGPAALGSENMRLPSFSNLPRSLAPSLK